MTDSIETVAEDIANPTGALAEKDKRAFRAVALGEKELHYNEHDDKFELSLIVKTPTMRQRNAAEALFNKTHNKLIKDPDHMSTHELMQMARDRGMWSEADDTKISVVDAEIVAKKEQVNAEEDETVKGTLISELNELRGTKVRLLLRLGQITKTSVENIAEKARFDYLLTQCVFKLADDGSLSLLYPTLEALNDETNSLMYERVYMDSRSFWVGNEFSDFLHFED